MLAVAGAFAGCGQLVRRRCPGRRRPAALAVAAALTVGGFAVGLARVVAAWSDESEHREG